MIEVCIISILLFILFSGLLWYISKLENIIKKYQLKDRFSTSEVSGAKKRIINFLAKEGNQFTNNNLHKELNKKKALNRDLFDVALNELRKEFMVVG